MIAAKITDLGKLDDFVKDLYNEVNIPENIKLDITLRLSQKEHDEISFKHFTPNILNTPIKDSIPKISQFQTFYGVVNVEIVPDFEEVQKELRTLITKGEDIPTELLERYNALKETLKTEANSSN